MFAKHAKSLGRALSVVTGLTFSHPSLAQGDGDDTARLPRPKVSSDAQYQLERNGINVGGYAIRVYFEEGKTFADLDAHVFYEPLIYLKTGQHGALLRNVEDDGLLTLYFAVETDTDILEGEIRKGLERTAQERSPTKITPESLKYRIGPLDLTAWFESSKRRLDGERMKSDELAKGPLNEKGRMPIYFETGSRENAVAFVNDLQHGRDQLVFKYSFSGISDEICKARFGGRAALDIDLYKKVVGDGGQGFVARHQAAHIADRMASSESLRVRCSNPAWATWLAEKLMKRLDAHEEITLSRENDWKRLAELSKFDSESFKADLIKKAKNIEKEVVRGQVLSAISKGMSSVDTEAMEAGLAGAYEAFFLGASGSFAESEAVSVAEARKEFSDMMEKSGVLEEWEGNVYVPKSVDVHSAADVHSAWSKTIDLEYVFPSGRTAEHSVNLTRRVFSVAQNVSTELRKELQSTLDRFESELEKTRRISQLGEAPVGGIIIFAGNVGNLPSNWKLCNGQRITDKDSPFYGSALPDLRGHFVRGAPSHNQYGDIGGLDERDTHRHDVRVSARIARDSLNGWLSRRILCLHDNEEPGLCNKGSKGITFEPWTNNEIHPQPGVRALVKEHDGKDSHGHNVETNTTVGWDTETNLDNRPRHINLHYVMRIK